MASGTHIIHRLVLEIEVPRRSMAKQVQDEALKQLEATLIPRLEELLDSMDVTDHVIIDHMRLDAGGIDPLQLYTHLEQCIPPSFEAAVQNVLAGNSDEEHPLTQLNMSQASFQAFYFFLLNGQLPWYIVPSVEWLQHKREWIIQLETAIREYGSLKKQLIEVFVQSDVAIKRLFAQFGRDFIMRMVIAIHDTDTPSFFKLADKISSFIDGYRVLIKEEHNVNFPADEFRWKLTFAMCLLSGKSVGEVMTLSDTVLGESGMFTSDNISHLFSDPLFFAKEVLSPSLGVIKPVPGILNEKNTKINDSPALKIDEKHGDAFVSQVGLVILHPYFNRFLSIFGLVQDGDFANIQARQMGIHLMHYMATGKVGAYEYELGFEKFLCNWPVNMPVERNVEIPQGMLDEADDMLRAVITHWAALKNTSILGLREAFLQRNGKLVMSEETSLLIVEKKGLDVLLATLPWGICLIKLPWMNKPLYVEWQ